MKSIAWLVPSLIEGSGGHRTILQNAIFLSNGGYKTIIYLENDACLNSGESGSDAISRLFSYGFDDVRIGWNSIERADAVFATIWHSAKVVRDLPFPCKRLYFVQDWEACFNPMGDTYLFAENSYRYGLTPITIGRWLPVELLSRFDVSAYHFDFCADRSIYRPLPNVQKERAVAFIYQPEKPRRGSQIGIEALGILKYHMPDVKVYLYGSREKGPIWFPHEHLGLLSLEECNALYNRVEIGLCISSSNPSRIPFEMMAAGLPVVELHRSNTIHDLPNDATLLCDQTPESIAEGLIQLFRQPQRLKDMRQHASEFMSHRDLIIGFEQFKSAVDATLSKDESVSGRNKLRPLYTEPPVVSGAFVNSIPAEVKKHLESRKLHKPNVILRLKKWSKRKLVNALS